MTPLQGRLRSPDGKSLCLILVVLLLVPATTYAEPQDGPVKDHVPPAQDWLEAADHREPLPVRLDGEPHGLLIEANDRILRHGTQTPGPLSVRPLKGTVVDHPGSHLRVTVVGEMLFGYIESPRLGRFTIGFDEHGGSTLARPAPAAPAAPEIPGEPGDEITLAADDFGCLHPLPVPLADPVGLLEGWPERWFDLAIAVDDEFVGRNGDFWSGRAVGLVNNADGFYFSQVNLSVGVVDLHVVENLTGSTTWELLTGLRSHYRTHHRDLDRDDVHLMTGKKLNGALGQSFCIGGAGNDDLAYTVGMTSHHDPFTFNGITLWGDIYTKILVHETSHILSAHHHYGNCVETAPFYYTSRPVDACTIMTNSADVIMLKYSMMNKLVTRGWVDHRDL